jgi:hypothetical protein
MPPSLANSIINFDALGSADARDGALHNSLLRDKTVRLQACVLDTPLALGSKGCNELQWPCQCQTSTLLCYCQHNHAGRRSSSCPLRAPCCFSAAASPSGAHPCPPSPPLPPFRDAAPSRAWPPSAPACRRASGCLARCCAPTWRHPLRMQWDAGDGTDTTVTNIVTGCRPCELASDRWCSHIWLLHV